MEVLSDRTGSLIECSKLPLLQSYNTCWYMRLLKSSCEFLPSDRFSSSPALAKMIPPFSSRSMQLMRSKRNFLLLSTLDQVQLLLHRMQPISCFYWIGGA